MRALDCSIVVYMTFIQLCIYTLIHVSIHLFNCVDCLCTIFDIVLIHNKDLQPFHKELNKFNHVPKEHCTLRKLYLVEQGH